MRIGHGPGLRPLPAQPGLRCRADRRHGNLDLAAEFDKHRSYLLRVARLQLRNDELAEDCVQDTLVAALQGAAGFSGKSSVKTWLTGILRHKIVDAIRRKTSAPSLRDARRRDATSTTSTRCSTRPAIGTTRPPTGATRRAISSARTS